MHCNNLAAGALWIALALQIPASQERLLFPFRFVACCSWYFFFLTHISTPSVHWNGYSAFPMTPPVTVISRRPQRIHGLLCLICNSWKPKIRHSITRMKMFSQPYLSSTTPMLRGIIHNVKRHTEPHTISATCSQTVSHSKSWRLSIRRMDSHPPTWRMQTSLRWSVGRKASRVVE